MGNEALDWMRNNMLFRYSMEEMSEYIDELVSRLPNLKKSEKIEDIKRMIRESHGITKGQLIQKLRWGGGITWTPYRRALMEDSNVYDIDGATPTYHWVWGEDEND